MVTSKVRTFGRWRNTVAVVFAVTLFSGAAAPAMQALDYHWNRLQDDWNREGRPLSGDWSDSQQWQSALCTGSYSYNVHSQGVLDDAKFAVQSDGNIRVEAKFIKVFANGNGRWRSTRTGCLPVSGWFGVGVEQAFVVVTLIFPDDPNAGFDKMSIRIEGTELTNVDMGNRLPSWFTQWLTRQLNRGLAYTWRSKLGAWLSKELSKYVVAQIPKTNK